MTGQPNAAQQDNDADLNESLLDVRPKNRFTLRNPLKPNSIPKIAKPKLEKPAVDKTAAVKVPLGKPAKRLPREPGQAPREMKPGLKLATTAQQRKLLPMLGVFLLLGAVSLYVNLGNASTAKPVTAFVGPGPGQVGYIPAPGTMNTSAAGTATTASMTPTTPGSAASGYMPAGTTPGMATAPAVTTTGAAGTGAGVTVSTTPPPVTITGSATNPVAGAATPGSAAQASKATPGKGSKTSAGSATTQAAKPGSGKAGTANAGVPGAPGSKPAPSPTDVRTEPVIPDVFSAADGGKGNAGDTGGPSTGNATASGNTVRNAPAVNVVAQPVSLGNVPLAALPRQVQIAQAAPLSIQSLPAPTPPPVQPQARSVPTLSAVPVALPRVVMAQVIPPVAQSLPLPAPITVRTPSGVTLTRGGAESTSTTPATPAAAPAAPSVVLVGTAQGDTPTVILATPDGQMIAGIGDHVTVNEVDYTISKINALSVILTHLKDTLTLTETN
jgi:hypothetical protein